MAIYTRFGSRVEVVASCGECQPEGFRVALTLLKIQYHDTTNESYYFMEFLRATDGWTEIKKAVEAAPDVTLGSDEINRAVKQAA